MRFGRLAWGIVAGIVGITCLYAARLIEMSWLGSTMPGSGWAVFVVGGGAVLWLADHFGLLAPPYTKPGLGLAEDVRGNDKDECDGDEDA